MGRKRDKKVSPEMEFFLRPAPIMEYKYETFEAAMEKAGLPAEMKEEIWKYIPEVERTKLVGGDGDLPDDPIEGPDYGSLGRDLPEYDLPFDEEDFELYGNMEFEETEEDEDYLEFDLDW